MQKADTRGVCSKRVSGDLSTNVVGMPWPVRLIHACMESAVRAGVPTVPHLRVLALSHPRATWSGFSYAILSIVTAQVRLIFYGWAVWS
jgi:hypothetical protein